MQLTHWDSEKRGSLAFYLFAFFLLADGTWALVENRPSNEVDVLAVLSFGAFVMGYFVHRIEGPIELRLNGVKFLICTKNIKKEVEQAEADLMEGRATKLDEVNQ